MRKSINALLLLILISAIWGANHGAQNETPSEEIGESQYTSEIQYGFSYGSEWPDFIDVRRSEGSPMSVGNSRNSVGTDNGISLTGETQKQTPVSGRIMDRLMGRMGNNTAVILGDFTITAYTNSPSDTGKRQGERGFGITASGAHTRAEHTVAADWSILPEGTVIEIEGLPGRYVVEDTGSGICGRHLDLFVGCEAAAVAWGVRKRTVTVIKWGTR